MQPLSTSTPNPNFSYTEALASHQACGYAYVIIGPDGTPFLPVTFYLGNNAIDHFLENIMRDKEILAEKLAIIIPLQMTQENGRAFQRATHCSICGETLQKDRVRDHDHITGAFRGTSHRSCNLKFRFVKKIPVVFHNLKN